MCVRCQLSNALGSVFIVSNCNIGCAYGDGTWQMQWGKYDLKYIVSIHIDHIYYFMSKLDSLQMPKVKFEDRGGEKEQLMGRERQIGRERDR